MNLVDMSMTIFALFCLGGLVIMDATLARPTGLRPDYGQRLYDFAFFLSLYFLSTIHTQWTGRISGT
jgi:hypothetical protein